MKHIRFNFVFICIAAAIVAIIFLRPRTQSADFAPSQPGDSRAVTPAVALPKEFAHNMMPTRISPLTNDHAKVNAPSQTIVFTTNKLERLTQIREIFHRLAAGDKATAMRAAKKITNEVERETALLTLVTEWTQGDLLPPRVRARLLDQYGLEASLGVELAKDPELAMLWANELTEGPGRAAIIQQTARMMVGTDPAAALALNEQLPEGDRKQFFDSLFGDWALKDTEAALQWADKFPDPTDRDAMLQAIRASAPVGIGAQLQIKDGYPSVNGLMAGSPAQLGGQLQPGDRIIALAQGDNAFMNMQNVALADVVQMIRGAPGTALQLQILAADAPPNAPPRTITIYRDQIKFRN